jgi:hypothetical protein
MGKDMTTMNTHIELKRILHEGRKAQLTTWDGDYRYNAAKPTRSRPCNKCSLPGNPVRWFQSLTNETMYGPIKVRLKQDNLHARNHVSVAGRTENFVVCVADQRPEVADAG